MDFTNAVGGDVQNQVLQKKNFLSLPIKWRSEDGVGSNCRKLGHGSEGSKLKPHLEPVGFYPNLKMNLAGSQRIFPGNVF